VEGDIDAPYERVWATVSDLERSVPSFDPAVSSLSIREREGERLVIDVRSPGVPVIVPFDVLLTDGFCLMRSRWRLYVVCMAAVPLAGGRTRFAHLEATRVPGVRRLLQGRIQRLVRADLRGIERLVT